MKKVLIGAALLVGAIVLSRRLAPTLGRRAMEKCQRMFEGDGSTERPVESVRPDLTPAIAG
jgi:hypothetical protein